MYRPHDLLKIDPAGLRAATAMPLWAQAALHEHPWVVVRRASCAPTGHIAVGLRGASRSQRLPLHVSQTAVLERLTPCALVDRIHPGLRSSPLPALRALPQLAAHLDNWSWGPGGSVGFHLATGAPCVHEHSDLDLLLYPQTTLSVTSAAQLQHRLQGLAVRADVLLEMTDGAYALAEYSAPSATLLCRTPHGPVLQPHPGRAPGA